jgi:cytochrome c biogenesis protein ResB
MTHVGLILLLIGGLFTSLLSIETRMILTEGDSKNYSIDERDTELVVIYSHDDELDEVVSVPQSGLKKGRILQPESLPFSLHIKEFYTNSDLLEAEKHGLESSEVNRGLGNGMAIKRRSDEISDNRINIVSAVVEIKAGQGDSQGIWLLSNGMITNSSNGEVIEQSFTYKDNTYRLVLRQKRYYNSYTIKLLDFSHDRYAGTDKPKNFSSEIILAQDDLKLNRKVLIYMNHPLRHGGKTYYQAGFNKETTTILQVVQNPSWLMPYISCTIITLGLLLQFFLHLSQFLKRKLASS